MIGAVVFGLLACLHVEGAPRDPAGPRTEPAEGTPAAGRSVALPGLPGEDGEEGDGLDQRPGITEAGDGSTLPVSARRDDESASAGEPWERDDAEDPSDPSDEFGGENENGENEKGENENAGDENAGDENAGDENAENENANGNENEKDNDNDNDNAGEIDTPSGGAPSTTRVGEHPPPPVSMATVLGSTRRRIANRLGSDGEDGDNGWVHYDRGLAIRYEGTRAVESAIRVPAGLTCAEAASWAGFQRAMPPLRRTGGCAWPGISARHRLHRGVVGELAWTTGILQIWSAKIRR